MDEAHKKAIVDAHNKVRSEIANGKIPNYDSAANMATIQWDDGLAANAALNVHQCVMKHDSCHTGKIVIKHTHTRTYRLPLLKWLLTYFPLFWTYLVYRYISFIWTKSCHGNDYCGSGDRTRSNCKSCKWMVQRTRKWQILWLDG